MDWDLFKKLNQAYIAGFISGFGFCLLIVLTIVFVNRKKNV